MKDLTHLDYLEAQEAPFMKILMTIKNYEQCRNPYVDSYVQGTLQVLINED